MPSLLLALALVAAVLGFGILGRRPWTPTAHVALCALTAPTCLLTPFSIAAGMYLLHPRTRAYFGAGPGRFFRPRRSPNEPAFATAVLGSLAAALLAGAAFLFGMRAPSGIAYEPPWKPEADVVNRLRAVGAAEESFRRVCNTGYADLDALRRPASVIPGFPPAARPFLSEDLARAEGHGYRFDLDVADAMAPTADCPTLRRYRAYRYSATPLSGKGRFFLLQSDDTIRWSTDRLPLPSDPALDAP